MVTVTTDIDAATLLVALIAIGISGAAAIFSWQSAQAAKRSAKAAETSATAADRSAAVAERDEQRQLEEAEANAVRWRPERLGDAKMKFWNVGTGRTTRAPCTRAMASRSAQAVGRWLRPATSRSTSHGGTALTGRCAIGPTGSSRTAPRAARNCWSTARTPYRSSSSSAPAAYFS